MPVMNAVTVMPIPMPLPYTGMVKMSEKNNIALPSSKNIPASLPIFLSLKALAKATAFPDYYRVPGADHYHFGN